MSAILGVALATAMSLNMTAKLEQVDGSAAVRLRTVNVPVPQASTRDLEGLLVPGDYRICVRTKQERRVGGIEFYVPRSAEIDVKVDGSQDAWASRCADITIVKDDGPGVVKVRAWGPTLNRMWVRNIHLRPAS
jgi:hypothetical protein